MPGDAFALIAGHLAEYPTELGCVLYFNDQKVPIGFAIVGRGDKSRTNYDLREIVRLGFLCHATACVLIHNHPEYMKEKTMMPSREDFKSAARCVRLTKQYGFACLDSIIVGKTVKKGKVYPAYYSMRNCQTTVIETARRQ